MEESHKTHRLHIKVGKDEEKKKKLYLRENLFPTHDKFDISGYIACTMKPSMKCKSDICRNETRLFLIEYNSIT